MPAGTEKRVRRARSETSNTNVISIVELLAAERYVRLERGTVAYAERLLERARADLREAERRRDGLRRGAGVC